MTESISDGISCAFVLVQYELAFSHDKSAAFDSFWIGDGLGQANNSG